MPQVGSAHGQPHAHLHPHRRRRPDPPRRHEPDRQDRPAPGGLRQRRRVERPDRRGPGDRRPRRGRRTGPDADPERPLRRGCRLLHPGRGGARLSPAAHRAGLRRPPRGLVRPLQRGAPRAALLHPQRRHRRSGSSPRGTHGRTPRRAGRLGGVGRARGDHEPPRHHLSQPALGPALHPRPARQPRERRRAVGPGRRATS